MNWKSALHPRDSNGRFVTSHSLRVSTRSVSYNRGVRTKLGPKANLYVGGIVRVERANAGPGPVAKARAKAYEHIAAKIPNSKFKSTAGSVLKGDNTDLAGGAKLKLSRPKPRSQFSIRKTTRSGAGPETVGRPSYTAAEGRPRKAVKGRQPRKPRAPRAPRANRISGSKTLAGTRV